MGGRVISSGHLDLASKIGSAVLIPNFFATSFFARTIPWRFSLSPQTATGRPKRVGLCSNETEAKKLLKSQCKIILSFNSHPPEQMFLNYYTPFPFKSKELKHFKFFQCLAVQSFGVSFAVI